MRATKKDLKQKLRQAVEEGTIIAKRRQTALIAVYGAREGESRIQAWRRWLNWALDGDRIYDLIRGAASRGSLKLVIGKVDAGLEIDEDLVEALNGLPGIRAVMRFEHASRHGDGSAPFDVVERWVEVTWSLPQEEGR